MQKAPDTRDVIRRLLTVSILLLLLVGFDRGSKLYFIQRSASDGSFWSSGVVAITQHHNFGIIGNLPLPPAVIIGLTLIVLGIVLRLFWKELRRGNAGACLTLTVLIAGAVGNLWDRLQWGFVFDWLLLFNRSVINAADIFIALGLGGYALFSYLTLSRSHE